MMMIDPAKYYEDVVTTKNIDYPNIKKGLDITKQFVIDNGLILIGGMAIDLAIKSTGADGIYDNTKLPDYDFLSSDSVSHSSKLANILCEEGLPSISDISALHVTTRRIRVNTVSVADIGYCPQIILDKIKYLEFDGLKIIHPHFQLMDIHRCLSFPFENPVYPVILHRWKRDMIRFDLLFTAFPIINDKDTISEKKMNTVNIDLINGSCVSGWAALSYWSDGTYKIPEGEPLHIVTDDFSYFVEKSEKPAIYMESLFGKLPRHVKVTIDGIDCEVYDNLGDNVSAEKVESHYVANLQHCMLIFLSKKYLSSVDINLYTSAYLNCMELVKLGAGKPGTFPSINVYGSKLWSDAYIIGRRDFASKLMDIKLENVDRPSPGYSKKPECDVVTTFDYSKSEYFALSGSVTDTFTPKTIEFYGVKDIICSENNYIDN